MNTMPTAFGFRPHNYTNRNTFKSGYHICAAVTFNPTGDFKPVAFGAEFNGMRYRYVIKSARLVKEHNVDRVFDCEYVDLGLLKTVRLVFNVRDCQWTVG